MYPCENRNAWQNHAVAHDRAPTDDRAVTDRARTQDNGLGQDPRMSAEHRGTSYQRRGVDVRRLVNHHGVHFCDAKRLGQQLAMSHKDVVLEPDDVPIVGQVIRWDRHPQMARYQTAGGHSVLQSREIRRLLIAAELLEG